MWVLLALPSCTSVPSTAPVEQADPAAVLRVDPPFAPNVLVLLMDDVGAEQISLYGEWQGQPATPNISRLAEQGVTFRNAYAMASCSPGRAALLTGRYPERYGIGTRHAAISDTRGGLPLAEITIPEMLATSTTDTWSTALVGKWHLANYSYQGAAHNPLDQGFGWAEGSLENLGTALTLAEATNYYHWERSTNGRIDVVDGYATTETVDAALRQIERMPEPWFLLVAFNAPHEPLHVPPATLQSRGLTDCVGLEGQAQCYGAMLEALDTELGRLVDSIDPDVAARTTTILTADNGTPEHGILPPFDRDRDKGTMFDGGVRVPFVVTGPMMRPQVRGTFTDGLVSITDIYGAVAEMAEIDLSTLTNPVTGAPLALDTVSFTEVLVDPTARRRAPRDDYVYAELFKDNGPPPYRIMNRMVRSAEAKLIEDEGVDELYVYLPDAVDEGPDLFDGAYPPWPALEHYMELRFMMDELLADLTYEGP